MRNILKTLGHMIAYVLYLLGPVRSGAVVLLYHAIEPSAWPWSVSPKKFERQMRFLARHRNVVPLTDVVSFVKGERTLPKNTVAITFDDGYADTYTTVLPILQKYGLHATVFLTTDLRPSDTLGNIPRLSEDQVNGLYISGTLSVEAHGRAHLRLTDMDGDPDAFVTELRGSVEDVERMTGRAPRLLAYAFGRKNNMVLERTRTLDFDAAFSTNADVVRVGVEPFAIPRVQVTGDTSMALFMLKTTCAVAMYKKIKNFFLDHTATIS